MTQPGRGVEAAKMIVNLLLLRGSEKTRLVPLDKLAELYGFEPSRSDGLTTVDAYDGVLKKKVRGFVSLGGNFLRAIPERSLMEPAWSVCGYLSRSRLDVARALRAAAHGPVGSRIWKAARTKSKIATKSNRGG
ncbi:MAG TPA: hypothetical protein VGH70_16430 [Bradyrhizobium sp.]|jgi:hypothetical protein